mgnify:CR=1 FL=1
MKPLNSSPLHRRDFLKFGAAAGVGAALANSGLAGTQAAPPDGKPLAGPAGLIDFKVPEFISDIAYSMGLAKDRKNVAADAKMKVLSIMNAIHNFVSGENFFRPMMKMEHDEYVQAAKDTLKFFNLTVFAG